MTTDSLSACENGKMGIINKLQIPNQFKSIGTAVFFLSLISLFANKFSLDNPDIKQLTKYGMLVGLLLISISKEKIEDELIIQLRMQSYAFAFVTGVVFTLARPFMEYAIDFLFTAKEPVLASIGDFEILWYMLSVQVLHFMILKRNHQ